MREQILEIIGFNIEPERAEIMADKLIELMKKEIALELKMEREGIYFPETEQEVEAVLRGEFVMRPRDRHAIAFMEWREKNIKKVSPDAIEELYKEFLKR